MSTSSSPVQCTTPPSSMHLSIICDLFAETKITDATLQTYQRRFSDLYCTRKEIPPAIISYADLQQSGFLPENLPNLKIFHLTRESSDDALRVLLPKAPRLTHIDLRENRDRKFDWLNDCILTDLLFFSTPFSPHFENATLVTIASKAQNLRFINLSGCSQIDYKALPLISMAFTNLNYLVLNQLPIDLDRGFSESFIFKKGRYLEIAGCSGISFAGINAIKSKFPKLAYLNASGTNLGDEELMLFAEKNRKIKRIDLTGCKKITSLALKQIGECCPKLIVLKVEGCDLITKAAIDELKRARPSLKVVSSFPEEQAGSAAFS